MSVAARAEAAGAIHTDVEKALFAPKRSPATNYAALAAAKRRA